MNHAVTIKDVVFLVIGGVVILAGGSMLISWLNDHFKDAWK